MGGLARAPRARRAVRPGVLAGGVLRRHARGGPRGDDGAPPALPDDRRDRAEPALPELELRPLPRPARDLRARDRPAVRLSPRRGTPSRERFPPEPPGSASRTALARAGRARHSSRAMEITFSPEEERFRERARAWIEANKPSVPPPENDLRARRDFDLAWQRKMHDAGWAGISWPKEYGGRGASLMEQLIWYEEFARAGAHE